MYAFAQYLNSDLPDVCVADSQHLLVLVNPTSASPVGTH